MAIHADTIWEIRQGATANNVNGGGFNASNAAPGTDRSQQNTAQDDGTDLVIDGADNTKVTSATHNFVADDQGNFIHITAGTGFTPGWYEVATTASNAATLDRACGSTGSTGGTWYLGGAISLGTAGVGDDDFFEQLIAGNTVYIKDEDSDFTLGESVSVGKDGTVSAPITIEGYKTDRGDNPTGADRPVIAAAALHFLFDNYYIMKNLIVTSTSTYGFRVDIGAQFINCKSTNTGAATRYGLYLGSSNALLFKCEAISTNGDAVRVTSVPSKIIGCYLHDSVRGAYGLVGPWFIIGNIFDTLTTALDMAGGDDSLVMNNTFYTCATGINATNGYRGIYINNIFDECSTAGAAWTSEQLTNVWDYNCWDNAGVTNVTKGSNAVNGDPGLTLPGSGDFTLGSGSNCLDAGSQVGTDQGATGDYKWNIGADQDDVTAAGGGGGMGYVVCF